MNVIKSNFNLENKLLKEGYDFVIGIDEAGRGPLAGPVVACACVLRCHAEFHAYRQAGISASQKKTGILKQVQDDRLLSLIRDSKTLSEKQREEIFDFIHENFYVGVGICDHKTIDRINILEASFLAMKKAVSSLVREISNSPNCLISNKIINSKFQNTKYIILVDGNKKIPNFSMEQRVIVNGDKIVKLISAASIAAKVTRDRIMRKMDEKYPEYQFARHKGYGTKLHMEMLAIYKPCEIHRHTFAPVRKLLIS